MCDLQECAHGDGTARAASTRNSGIAHSELPGLDSERGIAWRATDSLALRSFLGLGREEKPPDHRRSCLETLPQAG